MFIYQQMYLITSQTEKREDLSDLKNKGLNAKGHYSFRKSHSFK